MDLIGRPNYWLHVLVCTNTRPPGGLPSCGPAGAEDVYAALRAWVVEHRLLAKIWITQTACLGWCNSEGTTVAVYPEGLFYRRVTEADCATLIDQHFRPLLARR